MYIKGLFSEEKPQLQDWGEKKHVPLNIVESETTDEDGKVKKQYTFDCVERVEEPLSVDTIVKAAAEGTFTSEQLSYITRNFAKQSDTLVARYKTLVEEVTAAAEAAGYE